MLHTVCPGVSKERTLWVLPSAPFAGPRDAGRLSSFSEVEVAL